MTVGIVGLGLIGGSVGLSLRDPGRQILGFDPNPSNAAVALERLCVDRLAPLEEVAASDVVFVAAPPATVVPVLETVRELRRSDTVFTDCTSVKGPVAEWAASVREPMFVPGHPMAGHEKSGPAFASAWMFRNARWMVTPMPFTNAGAVKTIESLVRAMGANPLRLSAEVHDRHVAVVSHLPHAMAAALVLMGDELERHDVGAGSWRDVTRVGGVDPDLWTQIFMGNRIELSRALDEFAQRMMSMSRDLAANDQAAVKQVFVDAQKAKARQVSVPETAEAVPAKTNKMRRRK
jgi:prephenate dehydrogenase